MGRLGDDQNRGEKKKAGCSSVSLRIDSTVPRLGNFEARVGLPGDISAVFD